MKKFLFIFFIIIICGCDKKEEQEELVKISSKGELLCVYKERNIATKTIYTSYYKYDFDNNGLLSSAINHEEIEFETEDKDIKKNYKEKIKEIVKEYDEIDGVTISSKYKGNNYYFEVTMNKDEMDEINKEKFNMNLDRINLYRYYSSMEYKCE